MAWTGQGELAGGRGAGDARGGKGWGWGRGCGEAAKDPPQGAEPSPGQRCRRSAVRKGWLAPPAATYPPALRPSRHGPRAFAPATPYTRAGASGVRGGGARRPFWGGAYVSAPGPRDVRLGFQAEDELGFAPGHIIPAENVLEARCPQLGSEKVRPGADRSVPLPP